MSPQPLHFKMYTVLFGGKHMKEYVLERMQKIGWFERGLFLLYTISSW